MQNDLLDVSPVSVAGQQKFDGHVFPLVLQCNTPGATLDATIDWVRVNRDELLGKASQHGAVLFRGFPLATPQDLDAFIAAFELPNFPYYESLSNAVRVNWTERVFSANEAPPEVTIFFHHEMAQTPIFPAKLFFFCQQPAEEGGATPICRSDVLFDRLAERCPQFARECEDKGLQYTNVMPAENDPKSGMGRSWQSTLGTKTREEAEARLRSLGYSWEWQPDGCLRATTPVLPGVREVSPGRKTFFNQLIAAFRGWKDSRNDPSKAIRLGDGSPLDREAVQVAIDLSEELAFDVPWQRGDAVLVDNFLVMHGRRTFRGTRKVLASLAEPHTHEPVGANA
ncbi:MAG: TauD/TfdA family dioxygenase [Planctomycetes bacterium]|nr:TauD/TfdA family dioxygenase [Planctomycetota bacterium]